MDVLLEGLLDRIAETRRRNVPRDVFHDCQRRIIDTLGCAVAAFDTEPGKMARTLAARYPDPNGASIWCTDLRASTDMAAFANGIMTRYLDGNDVYPGGGGHPSDIIPPVLAVAQKAGSTGRETMLAIVTGYEIYHALFRGANLFAAGVDHVFYNTVATTCAVGCLLGFDRFQQCQALAIAIVSSLPLGATRRGTLSMWNGCASGNAGRNGVFACLLAQEGFEGPARPIDGLLGLEALVNRPCLLAPQEGFSILEADFKAMPVEYHAQLPLMLLLDLLAGEPSERIEAISVQTYRFAYEEIGSGPEKWRPATRKAADHSLPYILAASVVDGGFSTAIFEQDRFRDPKITAIMDRISISECSDYTSTEDGSLPGRVELRLTGGEVRIAHGAFPRGHHRNPMTDGEVEAKFESLTAGRLNGNQQERVLKAAWGLESARSVRPLIATLA